MLSHKMFRVYDNVYVNYESKNYTKTLFTSYCVEIDFILKPLSGINYSEN